MKKTVLLFSFILLTCTMILIAQDGTLKGEERNALTFSRPVENSINYDELLIAKKLEYELTPIDNKSFKVKFINQPSDYLDIKIYDVIGNLILKESVKQAKNSELEYQFDEIRSKIFVIKVKSGKENLTKKINL